MSDPPELLDQLIAKQRDIDAEQARELHLYLDGQGIDTHDGEHKPLTLLQRVMLLSDH